MGREQYRDADPMDAKTDGKILRSGSERLFEQAGAAIPMNMTAADRELRNFRLFAEHGPLSIMSDSIHSMVPPAPDILCTVKSGQQIAFELVELVDQDYARRLDLLYRTLKLLRELPARLPNDVREALSQRFSQGAFISFDFTEELRLSQREPAAVDALRWMLARPHALPEHVHVEGSLAGRVRFIHVRPWSWGLHFDCSSSGWLGDPTLERITGKFTKKYKTEHPIELLMYTELDLLLPESAWRPTVEPYVEAHLCESPFRRVWLFKAGAAEISFVYPSLA